MSVHRMTSFRVHIASKRGNAGLSPDLGDVSSIDAVLLKLGTDIGLTGPSIALACLHGTIECKAAARHVHLRPCVKVPDPEQLEPVKSRDPIASFQDTWK